MLHACAGQNESSLLQRLLLMLLMLLRAFLSSQVVEVVPVGDPRLAAYQQQCPSRATA